MTATPPIVDRENLAEADRHAARQGEGARERTRLARSRSSTPSRSRSQQFALGSVGGSACETDLAECATWISFGSRSPSTLTIRWRWIAQAVAGTMTIYQANRIDSRTQHGAEPDKQQTER